MAAHNNNSCRRVRQQSIGPQLPARPVNEPAVRRWPHPTPKSSPPESLAEELHSLYRALEHQGQLLLELRALMEQLAEKRS